jgi:hypothetical protein
VKIESTLIWLFERRVLAAKEGSAYEESATNSRPDLYTTLVRVVIAYDVHLGLGEFDDAFLLQLLNRLYNSWMCEGF